MKTVNLKKVLGLALALAMLLSLLTACGTTPQSSAKGSVSSAPAPTAEPTTSEPDPSTPEIPDETPGAEPGVMTLPLTEEPVTYSWYVSAPPIINNFVDEAWYDYVAYAEWSERTNVYIDYQINSVQAEKENFNIMMTSGDYTDIIHTSLLSGSVDDYVEDGIIHDLKALIPEYMPNYLKAGETWPEFGASFGSESDKGYWPTVHFYDLNKTINYGPIARLDWLEKLDMDLPQTYDDYYNMLTAFKTEMGADAPLWIPANGVLAGNYLIAGFGIAGFTSPSLPDTAFYQVGGKAGFGPMEDAYLDYLTMMNKWYSEGLIFQDFMTTKESDTNCPHELVTTGRTGVWYRNVNNLHEFDDKSSDPDFSVTAIYDAVKNPGDKNHLRESNEGVSKNGAAVTSHCAEEDLPLLLQFFDYIYTEDGMILSNYGVEGVSYEMVDGKPQLSDVVIASDTIPAVSLALTVYAFGSTYFTGITDYSKLDITYTEKQLESQKLWGAADTDYLISNLVSLNSDESAEFNSLWPDIETCLNENTLLFITTGVTQEQFDAFRGKLTDLGIKRCIELYQQALDR